jgi:uncharacterized protein (TIGR00251 family)
VTGSFWKVLPDGLELSVRATPKGGRDGVDGVKVDAAGAHGLAVRVSAPPDDGKATKAVAKVLAFHFGVAARDVTLASGATARLKRFRISGDPAQLEAVARAVMQEDECPRP